MSEKTKLTMNNVFLFIITILLSIIGFFYVDEVKDQQIVDATQTEAINKLYDLSNSQNQRITRVETKIGLY